MTHIITICGNTETIVDGYDANDLPSETCRDLATEWCEHVAQMIRAASLAGLDVDYETCSDFRQYHGGKFADQAKMYGNTGGQVSCKVDAPKMIHDLCDQALDAASEVLEKSIEREQSELAE